MYLLLFLLLCINLTAQTLPGSCQAAFSYSDVAYSSDVFSVFSNAASNAKIQKRQTGIFYSPSPFGLKELAATSAVHTETFFFGSITAGFLIYGYELYRENKFIFSMASGISDDLYMGITGCYNNIDIKNYGNAGVLTFDIGFLADIFQDFSFGISFRNISHSTAGNDSDQLPMNFNSGVTYSYSEIFLLHFSLQKELRYNFNFLGGFEYKVFDVLSLRSGFSNESNRFSAGIGLHIAPFRVDYSILLHPELGMSHTFGIISSLGV